MTHNKSVCFLPHIVIFHFWEHMGSKGRVLNWGPYGCVGTLPASLGPRARNYEVHMQTYNMRWRRSGTYVKHILGIWLVVFEGLLWISYCSLVPSLPSKPDPSMVLRSSCCDKLYGKFLWKVQVVLREGLPELVRQANWFNQMCDMHVYMYIGVAVWTQFERLVYRLSQRKVGLATGPKHLNMMRAYRGF